jgi:hypothetical protein
VADTDVWPFWQVLSPNENMQSAPASGIQARATLGIENVPMSASLFMVL